MNTFWHYHFLGNTIQDWSIAIGIILGAFFVIGIFRGVVVSRLKSLSEKTQTTLDDFAVGLLQTSVMPLVHLLAIYMGLQYLHFSPKVAKVMHIGIMVVAAFFIIRVINSFIAYIFNRAIAGSDVDLQRKRQASGILLILKLVVWLIGLLFLIDNLGYDITTIVAGLGIGGIAIALAAQTILGDLFSYIVIFLDKPFQVGDFIVVDDKKGVVEFIGIKTTRIQTLSGEQLICSNTDLTKARVHNFKKMQERRVDFSFGVVYDTPLEKLKQIPVMVKEIISSREGVRLDRAHFKNLGPYSLNFEVIFYVLSPEYNVFMDIQQELNFRLMELFQKEGIEFAFPTQTIYMAGSNGSVQATEAPAVA